MKLARPLAATLCTLLAGCTTGTPAAGPSPPVSGPRTSVGADWPAYHRTADRTGVLPGSGTFSGAVVAWRSEVLDGDVYASPLIVGSRAYVATANNTVYAFELASGRLAWTRHLADPVVASTLPCGNISPVSGITGTPVANAASGALHVVAFAAPGRHRLFTLSLADGSVRSQVGVDAPGADPLIHQQRAALALGNNHVYVAYGGLYGDCGDYHGEVVGVPLAGGSNLVYRVPSGEAAGFWAPSGPALDSAGNLYVTSGNSFSNGSFDYGNAVIKLSPSLSVLDWFAPSDWPALNRVDADLGSMGPLLLSDELLFQAGKTGRGYLLRTSSLGHVGGQAFAAPVCPGGAGVFGGAAAVLPLVYVPCPTGILALRLDARAPAFATAWRGPSFGAGPPIVAGGAVWSADPSGGVLHALDPASGRELYSAQVGEMMHFATPAATDGYVLVAAGRRLVVFGLS